ncbi:hypothetical protein [Actinoplanes sp. M2I2]|uniref:hypothetical protein n=1 Tax=Actinoplanes sp. M2I2 TaxID=1734444 RepID=UPI002020AD91|nr:hypothetical protein [Actinoplanes sp. M2I2]
MKRKAIGTVLTGTLAMSGAVFGTAGPALAAGRSEACQPSACGSATFTFKGKYQIAPISYSIRDTECGGGSDQAYVRLRVSFIGTTTQWVSKKWEDEVQCDNSYATYNSSYGAVNNLPIESAWVVVGDDNNGTSWGEPVDNPNT